MKQMCKELALLTKSLGRHFLKENHNISISGKVELFLNVMQNMYDYDFLKMKIFTKKVWTVRHMFFTKF